MFLAVPISLFAFRRQFGSIIVPSLVALGVICTALLLFDRRFERIRFWNTRHFGRHLRRTLLRFLPLALLVGGLTALLRPDLLFAFPRSRPGLWLAVILLYPIFSVYPRS